MRLTSTAACGCRCYRRCFRPSSAADSGGRSRGRTGSQEPGQDGAPVARACGRWLRTAVIFTRPRSMSGSRSDGGSGTKDTRMTAHLLPAPARPVSASSSAFLSWQLEAGAGSRIGRASEHWGGGSSPVSPLPLSSLSSPAIIGRIMRLWVRPGDTTSSSLSSPVGAGEVTGTGPQVHNGCGDGATDRIRTE